MHTETYLIAGPAGQIELVVESPTIPFPSAVGVVCHPHPLYGGAMTNKVVTTTAKALQQLGLATVRFNFRGIGKSVGTYDEGRGELQDLLAVLNWIKVTYTPTSFWLAGFSFGSHIAFQGCLQWPCDQLITIAPPIMRFDFTQTNEIKCPWLLVQGEEDEVVDPAAVFEWVKTISAPIEVIRMPGATHFFHGKLIELRDEMVQSLQNLHATKI